MTYTQLPVPWALLTGLQAVIAPPCQVTVVWSLAGLYPVQANVTELPPGPEVGETVSCGTTVKVAVAAPEFASVPVNTCAPTMAGGIENAQLKFPAAPVVVEQTIPPAQAIETAALGA